MANRSRFEIAKKDIISYFQKSSQKAFNTAAISEILGENRDFWRLASSTSTDDFIKLLLKHTKLQEYAIKEQNRERPIYSWGDVSVFSLALASQRRSFLCHYTAVYLHGLTDQIPKTIYLNQEQTPKKDTDFAALPQEAIDEAFGKEQRESGSVFLCEPYRIVLIKGKYSGNLGVVEHTFENGERISMTGLERTLIDIAVRPAYSGGVYEVLEAYRRAAPEVSVNKLVGMLKKLNYRYPYHQAIGFYLEQAGNYRPSQINLLRKMGMGVDFYLAHAMAEVEYSPEWRLYYPKGFKG